ncbi:MAG: pantetheine-phosphate adenylyltransferase [Nanoarchaeota archaeon]
MTQALYAFSADPIHNGHIDLIARAAGHFEHLTAVIAVNGGKSYTFSLEERLDMARHSLEHLSNVTVTSFPRLLVDYAYQQGIPVIIKGVRDSADYTYEKLLYEVGETQQTGIETFLLPAHRDKAHISSTAVKEIQRNQGDIHEYVPLYVKQKLEARISGQYILGVIGDMGCGKSYVSQKFAEIGQQKDITVHPIELDHIGHCILRALKEPAYQATRDQIAERFGKHLQKPDGSIRRKELGEIVFGNPEELEAFNQLLLHPILTHLRKELYGKQGLILLNAALLAETNTTYLCNHNVLLVEANAPLQEQRLKARGLTPEQIQKRLQSQYRSSQKEQHLLEQIRKDRNGRLWKLDNNGTPALEPLLDSIVETLHVKP